MIVAISWWTHSVRYLRGNALGLSAALLFWSVACPSFAAAQGVESTGGISIVVPGELSLTDQTPTPFTIQINWQHSKTDGGVLLVNNLPEGATFNSGFRVTESGWLLPVDSLEKLELTVPGSFASSKEVIIKLLTRERLLVAQTTTNLVSDHERSAANGLAAQQPDSPTASLGEQPSEPAEPGESTANSEEIALITPIGSQQVSSQEHSLDDAAEGPASLEKLQLTEQQEQRAKRLMKKGDEALQTGNLLAARLFYEKAANIGLSEAALALGQTYDPYELARMRVVGAEPDPARAEEWYAKARTLSAGYRP